MTITAAKLYSSRTSHRCEKISGELERKFFSMIRINGRVNKTTWEGRLAEVNEDLEIYLGQAGLSPRRFLDVGVSSGISTWDWFRRLKVTGRSFTMTATDLIFNTYLVSVGPALRVLADSQGAALQYDFFGYGIRPGHPRPRDWLTGVVAISAFMKLAYRRRLRQLGLTDGHVISDDFPSAIMMQPGVRELQLVSPRIPHDCEISFFEDNLFQPAPDEMKGYFDVIRAANLLNYDYFGNAEIIAICQRLKQCMSRPNGLLIVCRTKSDRSNHGTIFRLSPDGVLTPVKRIGQGSEIETIVAEA